MNSPYSFKKQERIVSRKLIDELFGGSSSQSMAAFPLRVIYINKVRAHNEPPAQLLISVPKRRFKHAVDRNRVKRQIREAYRRHKEILTSRLPDDRYVLMAFVWLSDSHLPTADVESRIVSLLERIAAKS